MDKITFIVQARTGSSRLPNKILLPFYQRNTLLDLLINKLKSIDNTEVVIATTTARTDDLIEQKAMEHNVVCFRGEELDVLQRFINAAHLVGARKIIRVCSDNPFLDVYAINELIANVEKSSNSTDYISFWVNGTPSIKTHYGFWTEYVTLKALEIVAKQTDDPLFHEHVTNFIYTYPAIFNLKWIKGPDILLNRTDIRLTIDTYTDFTNAQSIYSELAKYSQYPCIKDVVNYLDEHNEMYASMKSEILKNSK